MDEDAVTTMRLTTRELSVLHGALQEVCSGPELDDWDFPIRMGAEREEAEALLRALAEVLRS